jgi:hypothetical protein
MKIKQIYKKLRVNYDQFKSLENFNVAKLYQIDKLNIMISK